MDKKQKRKDQICRLIEEFRGAFPNDKAFLVSEKLLGFYAQNNPSSEEEREEFQLNLDSYLQDLMNDFFMFRKKHQGISNLEFQDLIKYWQKLPVSDKQKLNLNYEDYQPF